jgi:hypothetical protein
LTFASAGGGSYDYHVRWRARRWTFWVRARTIQCRQELIQDMPPIKAKLETTFRHLERKLGIDREGRSVWVWLLPPAIGLVTALLVPFMPGLPADMGLFDRVTLAVFGLVTMTAIASIYLISFDNDHNQQAAVEDPPGRGNDDPHGRPAPSGTPPPHWLRTLEALPDTAKDRPEQAGDASRRKVPAASGTPR